VGQSRTEKIGGTGDNRLKRTSRKEDQKCASSPLWGEGNTVYSGKWGEKKGTGSASEGPISSREIIRLVGVLGIGTLELTPSEFNPAKFRKGEAIDESEYHAC